MTIPTLPTGARLALINWPGGHPDWRAIVASAGPNARGHARSFRQVVEPLLAWSLIEDAPSPPHKRCTFRLTQPGRKALDVLQSGVE
jgi:hypothetical protein